MRIDNRHSGRLKNLIWCKLSKDFPFIFQVIKFSLVGVSNTFISYVVEMLCYYLLFVDSRFTFIQTFLKLMKIQVELDLIRIWLSTFLAFLVGTSNSYYWNCRFVFVPLNGKKSFGQHMISYFKMILCYAFTGLLLAPNLKFWLMSSGMPYWVVGFLSLIVVIPVNFILNKFWVFAISGSKDNIAP